MGFLPSIGLAAFMAAVTAFCGWRGALRPRVNGEPRLIPWRFLMLLAFIGLIICTGHIAALVGGP